MAGTYIEYRCTSRQKPLVHQFMRYLQGKAKLKHIALSYRWNGDHYHIELDGNLYDLQSFTISMFQNLLPFSEGCSGGIPTKERLRLAKRLCVEYYNEIERFSRDMLSYSRMFGAHPHSFIFFPDKYPHLDKRIRSLTYLLLLYWAGYLTPEHMIEELHTVIGLLLALESRLKKTSYQDMASHLLKSSRISEEYFDTIIEIKNIRKRVKHKGQNITYNKLDSLIDGGVKIIHQFLGK